MKMNVREMQIRMNEVRARGPRATYQEMYACDQTRGIALEVRGGRLVERIARRKIFFQLYI